MTADVILLGSEITADTVNDCYTAQRKTTGDEFETVPITDFLFEPEYLVKVDGNEARTVFKASVRSVSYDIPSSVFDTTQAFTKWCHSRGLQWSGTLANLTGLYHWMLAADRPRLHGVESVGLVWPKDRHDWSFILPNGDVIGEQGIYAYVEPAIGDYWSNPKATELYEGTEFDLSVIQDLAKLNRPEAITPILGWLTAAPLRALFVDGFPVLVVHGQSGSGRRVTGECSSS
jgi:hypothetical protein